MLNKNRFLSFFIYEKRVEEKHFSIFFKIVSKNLNYKQSFKKHLSPIMNDRKKVVLKL